MNNQVSFNPEMCSSFETNEAIAYLIVTLATVVICFILVLFKYFREDKLCKVIDANESINSFTFSQEVFNAWDFSANIPSVSLEGVSVLTKKGSSTTAQIIVGDNPIAVKTSHVFEGADSKLFKCIEQDMSNYSSQLANILNQLLEDYHIKNSRHKRTHAKQTILNSKRIVGFFAFVLYQCASLTCIISLTIYSQRMSVYLRRCPCSLLALFIHDSCFFA